MLSLDITCSVSLLSIPPIMVYSLSPSFSIYYPLKEQGSNQSTPLFMPSLTPGTALI